MQASIFSDFCIVFLLAASFYSDLAGYCCQIFIRNKEKQGAADVETFLCRNNKSQINQYEKNTHLYDEYWKMFVLHQLKT